MAVVLSSTLSATYAVDIPCVIQQDKICQVEEKLHITAEDDLKILNTDDVTKLKQFIINGPATVETVPKQLFKSLPNLEDVRFSGVQLNQLKSKDSFESASSLRSVEISRNNLKVIPRDAFVLASKLIVLDLTLNKIETVEGGAFNGLTRLKNLYLDRNQITTLKRDVFADCSQLIELYLNDNRISAIEEGTFDLPELKILSIKNNLLRSLPPNVFVNAPKLENVDLSSNELVNVGSAFDKSEALTKLDLSNNSELEDVNVTKLILLPALLWLSLRNTSLVITPPAIGIVPAVPPTTRLSTLDLSDTKLTNTDLLLHLQHLKDLEKLNLRNNELTKLDRIEDIPTFFPKLTELDLSNNKLDCGWLDTLHKVAESKGIIIGDDLKCVP